MALQEHAYQWMALIKALINRRITGLEHMCKSKGGTIKNSYGERRSQSIPLVARASDATGQRAQWVIIAPARARRLYVV